ncbi:hypothetical protein ANN_14305 [Periplaneta americana]|uniref:Reverse transcriptase domain-containing protein n=1 Tax=Periplaneta americana TaxID=6978 RepID=A0ABQ8SX61_PERAM|nr:hypothetical protein ANN_14305 [Periplaneta americana]
MRLARCEARLAQIRTTREILSGFYGCEIFMKIYTVVTGSKLVLYTSSNSLDCFCFDLILAIMENLSWTATTSSKALALAADCTLAKITRSQQCVPITKRNSVNTENRTHVYMTFFAQNVFGNKLRKERILHAFMTVKEFADDQILMATNENDLQTMIHCLNQLTKQYRMKISTNETKIIAFKGKGPIMNYRYRIIAKGSRTERLISHPHILSLFINFLVYT